MLIKCHTSHTHSPLNILNHFEVNLARIAAIWRDHNFVLVAAIVIILMTVVVLRRCLALPLTATLLLNLWLLLLLRIRTSKSTFTILLLFSTLFIFLAVVNRRLLTPSRRAKRRIAAQLVYLFNGRSICCRLLLSSLRYKRHLFFMGDSFLIPTASLLRMLLATLLLTWLKLRLLLEINMRLSWLGRDRSVYLLVRRRIQPFFHDNNIGVATLCCHNSNTSVLLLDNICDSGRLRLQANLRTSGHKWFLWYKIIRRAWHHARWWLLCRCCRQR